MSRGNFARSLSCLSTPIVWEGIKHHKHRGWGWRVGGSLFLTMNSSLFLTMNKNWCPLLSHSYHTLCNSTSLATVTLLSHTL